MSDNFTQNNLKANQAEWNLTVGVLTRKMAFSMVNLPEVNLIWVLVSHTKQWCLQTICAVYQRKNVSHISVCVPLDFQNKQDFYQENYRN